MVNLPILFLFYEKYLAKRLYKMPKAKATSAKNNTYFLIFCLISYAIIAVVLAYTLTVYVFIFFVLFNNDQTLLSYNLIC